jgi:hypothetical protein
MILEKYALPNLLKEYFYNKDRIAAYFKNEPVQHYRLMGAQNGDLTITDPNGILGLSIAFFTILIFVSLAIWLVAIYMIIANWNNLEDWAKVISILGLLTGFVGPIVTIIIVIVGKKKTKKN